MYICKIVYIFATKYKIDNIMGSDKNIQNITGTPVTGKNFFGRTEEVKKAWKLIEAGESLKLDAPRRVGKSSFAHKMKDIAIEKGWNYVFCNVQKCHSENSFFENFITELEKNSLYKKLRNKLTPTKITLSPEALGYNIGSIEWENHCKDCYTRLQKELNHKKDTLIIIDELTVYLSHLKGKDNKRINSAIFSLDWLDSLRQNPDRKIRWILCSSISIDYFIDEHEISNKMRGLKSLPIDQLNNTEAVLLIEALAKSANLTFSKEAKQCVLNKLVWLLPFYIQKLFHEIKNLEETDITSENIEQAYQNLLDSAEKDNYFKTMVQDLKNHKDKKNIAQLLLNQISSQANGSSLNVLKSLIVDKIKDVEKAENILKDLLKKLKNDGYIMLNKSDNKYLFRSPLLRDFWYNTFVKK